MATHNQILDSTQATILQKKVMPWQDLVRLLPTCSPANCTVVWLTTSWGDFSLKISIHTISAHYTHEGLPVCGLCIFASKQNLNLCARLISEQGAWFMLPKFPTHHILSIILARTQSWRESTFIIKTFQTSSRVIGNDGEKEDLRSMEWGLLVPGWRFFSFAGFQDQPTEPHAFIHPWVWVSSNFVTMN